MRMFFLVIALLTIHFAINYTSSAQAQHAQAPSVPQSKLALLTDRNN